MRNVLIYVAIITTIVVVHSLASEFVITGSVLIEASFLGGGWERKPHNDVE